MLNHIILGVLSEYQYVAVSLRVLMGERNDVNKQRKNSPSVFR